jgi:hypothetical protein
VNPSEPINPPSPAIPGENGDAGGNGNAEGSNGIDESGDPVGNDEPGSEAATVPAMAENGGTGAVSGLPAGADGTLYFAWDGSAPLELRIDIALAEFEGMDFDGEPWTLGTDYDVRSGSTVLTVGAARLETVEAGMHTLRARFTAETVEIPFELRKPVAATANVPATGDSGTGDAAEDERRMPGAPIAVAAIVLLIALGTVFFAIRKRRAPGSGPLSTARKERARHRAHCASNAQMRSVFHAGAPGFDLQNAAFLNLL